MTTTPPAPPFDPELAEALRTLPIPPTITPELMEMTKQAPPISSIDQTLADAGISRQDETIPGYRGDDIVVSILRREGQTGVAPGVFHAHGGGLISGDRFTTVEGVLPWIVELSVVFVTVEYRLAPRHPDPYPVEDCYAGLVWTAENAERLGIDPDRLVIAGSSAGGGLAAGTALLARDRRGPRLRGQVLMCPMIDDRDRTVSSAQIDGIGVWDRGSNRFGWSALLGDRRGTDDVSIYAAPARATDLSGLPPTYIDCGSAEVFRDEDVAYAGAIWAAGGNADLHVWAGGFHGFDNLAPGARVSQAAIATRKNWLARLLSV